MSIDLAGLSPVELTKLIERANAQMAAARSNEIAKAKGKIDAILSSAGLTIDDVFPRRGPASKARKRAGDRAPKYRNPNNPEQTWSGMGKRPRWLADALASGAKLDAFAIGAKLSTPSASKKIPANHRKPTSKQTGAAKKSSRK